MTIQQIYDLAIKLGMQNDLRGPAAVRRKLQREKERYEELSGEKKKEYDLERLRNPYSDTRMFADRPDKPVRRILTGIDIQTEEVLLAKELSKEKPIDLILSHHPVGPALAGLHEVMGLQAEVLANYGVPINVAESLTRLRLQEVSRSVSSANHNRVLDAAKLLGFEMMCTHTATDNMVAMYLHKLLQKSKKKIERVGDLMKLLKGIPEYAKATTLKAGPMIFTGSEDSHVGNVALVEITGGTNGSKMIYEKMSQAGIGTVLGMHMHEEYKKEAEKHHINVIIAGHMSSDSIGMNLFLDELEKRGVEVIACSGLLRISRRKAAKKKRTNSKKRKK